MDLIYLYVGSFYFSVQLFSMLEINQIKSFLLQCDIFHLKLAVWLFSVTSQQDCNLLQDALLIIIR